MARITLLTDFGTADGYVGAMKGVIASIAPDALIDDVSHDIPQGDVHAAAWALAGYWRLYPPGTVHLIVVDPGVGGERRAIAAEADGRLLVAPDNGVLSRALEAAEEVGAVHALEAERYRRPEVSLTFHGRDLFAPAAAHLALGVPIGAVGSAVEDPVRLELTTPVAGGNVVIGRVVHVDRFGNLVSDIPAEQIPSGAVVSVGGRSIGPLRGTYSDVAPGMLLALIGSGGQLEVAVRDGSAHRVLRAERGAPVRAQSVGKR